MVHTLSKDFNTFFSLRLCGWKNSSTRLTLLFSCRCICLCNFCRYWFAVRIAAASFSSSRPNCQWDILPHTSFSNIVYTIILNQSINSMVASFTLFLSEYSMIREDSFHLELPIYILIRVISPLKLVILHLDVADVDVESTNTLVSIPSWCVALQSIEAIT